MIKLLRNTGVALLLSGMMIVNTVPSYSVDNGFIANIKELKELSDIMNIIKGNDGVFTRSSFKLFYKRGIRKF